MEQDDRTELEQDLVEELVVRCLEHTGELNLEAVASILMVEKGFVHPSINCEDVHPEIEPHAASIPHEMLDLPDLDVLVKAGFGFGDVNACLVFKRYKEA